MLGVLLDLLGVVVLLPLDVKLDFLPLTWDLVLLLGDTTSDLLSWAPFSFPECFMIDLGDLAEDLDEDAACDLRDTDGTGSEKFLVSLVL